MGRTQKPARPPFAFPLCRDSLCNTYSVEYGLWYAPIETTFWVLNILRNKRYFIEIAWQTQGVGVVVLTQDGDVRSHGWLSEKLDLGDNSLLDFLAEAFVEHFKKNKGIYKPGSLISIELVAHDSIMSWRVASIDFDKGEVHLIDSSQGSSTYPMPQDISQYSDVEIGDTGGGWGALMKAAAIAFFMKDAKEFLIDIINRRIMDKIGVVVYSVSIPLSRVRVTGREVVLIDFVGDFLHERSNINLSVSTAPVNNIYLPARFWGGGQYVPPVLEYGHEHYARTEDAYLYCKPNEELVFVELEGKYYRIKANVKAHGVERAKLALDKNTWIRILRWSSTRRGAHGGIVSFYPILHLSIHEDKSGDSFTRKSFPISVIKLLAERFSSIGS